MGNRRYAPAHVKNPTSMQHIVRLCPGQTFMLHLKENEYPNPKVYVTTNNLRQFTCGNSVNEHQYLFVQDEAVYGWAAHSSCVIANVWIHSDYITARLMIMLDCQKFRHLSPTVREIDLKLLSEGPLEYGCTTIPAMLDENLDLGTFVCPEEMASATGQCHARLSIFHGEAYRDIYEGW